MSSKGAEQNNQRQKEVVRVHGRTRVSAEADRKVEKESLTRGDQTSMMKPDCEVSSNFEIDTLFGREPKVDKAAQA